jgi:hypothetical protein
MRYYSYDINKKREFQKRLLNDLGVNHEVFGLEIRRINDNKSCAIRLIPSSSEPQEYRISNKLLRELKNENIIERKSRIKNKN